MTRLESSDASVDSNGGVIGDQTVTVTGQFGDVLRELRSRVRPEDLGLPTARRRTPGIRREELAALAAVSPEYVKRLEQNRAHPSPQVISSLANALRLTRVQHEHLSRLAGFTPAHGEAVPRVVPQSVKRFLTRTHTPVGVFDPAWTLIAWNAPWHEFLSVLTEAEGRERNLIWRRFMGIPSGVEHRGEDIDRSEAALLADLRAVTARYPGDQFIAALVGDLAASVPRFAALWDGADVADHESATKTLIHPTVGRVAVDCDALIVREVDLRILVFTAEPGSPDADKLEKVWNLTKKRTT